MINNPSYDRVKCECFIVPFVGIFQIFFLLLANIFGCIFSTLKQCCLGLTLNKEEAEAIKCMRKARKKRAEATECAEVVTQDPGCRGKYIRGTWGGSTAEEECGTCIGIFQPVSDKECKKLMKHLSKCKGGEARCSEDDDPCDRKKTRSICTEIKQVKCKCKKTKCKKCKVNRIPVVIYNQAKVCKQSSAKCRYKPPQFMECRLRSVTCEPPCGKKRKKKAHKPIQFYECYRQGACQPVCYIATCKKDCSHVNTCHTK